MNQNSISKIALPLLMMVVSLFLVVDLLTSGGNAVAQVYRYCFFGAAVFGLLSPRKGFYLLIFLTAYLDFFKRMMIFDSGVSMMDVYLVLGIGPALLCGIGCSILYSLMSSDRKGNGQLLKLSMMVLAVCAVLAVVALGVTGSMREKADSINGIIYLPLLFIVPAMFQSPEEIRGMLRNLTFIYVPAIIYMLIHWARATFFGMNPPIFDWEMAYLKSGLTIEIRQLSGLVFRPFGTFNSAANASMIFAMLFALVLGGWWALPPRTKSAMTPMRVVLLPLILISMVATYSRTGWILLLAVLVAMFLFKRKMATLAFYAVSALTLLITVLASPYLLKTDALNTWSGIILSEVGAGDKMTQAASIGSMNARLVGFAALATNGNVWTPFGFKFAYANPRQAMARIEAHDVITLALMKFGYFPIALLFLVGARLLYVLHRFLYEQKDPLIKSLAASCLSVAIVLVLGGTVNFAQFITFPVNFWIWLMFGCVVSLIRFESIRVSQNIETARSAFTRPAYVKGRGMLPLASVSNRG